MSSKFRKLTIRSYNVGFGPCPAFNDEVEQRVTIHSSGRVKITRYIFGMKVQDPVKAFEEEIQISKETADEILNKADICFDGQGIDEIVTDVGRWKAKLTRSDGSARKEWGSLIYVDDANFAALNRVIRKALGRNYKLFLFDGGYEEEQKYIYIGVRFTRDGKTYDYLTDDDSIMPGDLVIVPVGSYSNEKMATVVSKNIFTEMEAFENGRLFPYELKNVIKKVTPIGVSDSERKSADSTPGEEKSNIDTPDESQDADGQDELRGNEISIGTIKIRNNHALIHKFRKENTVLCRVIWNEVVREGMAFPQTDELGEDEAYHFFRNQYTAVAELNGQVVGLYILHPNNVGRVGHIANASYAVGSAFRGLHIGELLVRDCLDQAAKQSYRILQFNAVVASNIHAYHLYERLGFVDLGVIPGGFLNKDGIYEDIHVMYHLLSSNKEN